MEPIEPKSLDDNWIDWEGNAFGFGYGTGEDHTIPALKAFLAACPETGAYNYQVLEAAVGPVVAWLLINRLCDYRIDMIEYGTSPRCGWLTKPGRALKAYTDANTAERLIELACNHDVDHNICYPDTCNHGPEGYVKGRHCPNPFWDKWRP